MSATNHTTNYELPIFIGTDKPAWLVDWNGAMTAIDTAIHTAEGKADQAGTDIGGIESSITTINGTLTSINNAVSQLRIDTNANTGNINTINSLIGNGTPTTTDKTIIGAINEINGKVLDFDFAQASPTMNSSVGTISEGASEIHAILNSTKSLGKIYGAISVNLSASTIPAESDLVTITIPGLDTQEAYDINGYIISVINKSTNVFTQYAGRLRFNVGNTVSVRCRAALDNQFSIYVSLPPCLLFLEDLGD